VFVQELRAIDAVLAGKFDAPRPDPPPAGPISEIVSTLEREGRDVIERLGRVSSADLDRSMPFPSGPGRMTEQRRMQLLWFMIMDGIHHRGQFSVYLRMVGARVPSIYGPSADEPWS
jgi:uncharacterized damage-inducible protein DinB